MRQRWASTHGAGLTLLCVVSACVSVWEARGATPALELSASSDVSVQLGGSVVHDEEVSRDDLMGAVVPVAFPGLDSGAAVTAFESLPGGDLLLAFESASCCPGTRPRSRPAPATSFG
jgi:hypothetical protein